MKRLHVKTAMPHRSFGALLARWVLVALLVPILSHPCSAKDAITYDQGIRKVRELIARKQFDDAERSLSTMLQRYPDNPELLSIRGRVRLWSNRPGEAVRDLERSLRLHKDPAVQAELVKAETAERIARAETYHAKGNSAEEERILRDLFEARRNLYDVGLRLGRMYTSTGDYGKARDIYRTLHQEYPREHDITLLYVRALIGAGNTERAKEEVANLPDEDHPSLHLARAAVVKNRGGYSEALEHYRRALRLQDDPSIQREINSLETLMALNKADSALASRKPELAEAILRPLYGNDGSRYDVGHRLARIALMRNDADEALAIYGRLAKDYPGDVDTTIAYIDTLMMVGKTDEANAVLGTLPVDTSPTLRLRRARLFNRTGRIAEALEEYRIIRKETSDPAVVEEAERAERADALQRASRLSAEGKTGEAEAIWRELFTSGRERYESGYRLGMASLKRREFLSAAEHFTGLSDEFPKDHGFYALATESWLLSKKLNKASAMVRDASPERADYLRREREDLIYRVRPNYAKLSGLVAGYDNGISPGRELALTVSQRIQPATLVVNAASIHRYGMDDTELGAEVTFPVPSRSDLYATTGFTVSPDAQFLAKTTFRGEMTWATGGREYSLGYTRMNFSNNGVNVIVLGILGYPGPELSLNERLYVVPEKGTFSLLSTINYEPNHRLRGYYSLGLGTASEKVERNAVDRHFTVTNRLGIEYRPVASFSGGGELFHEFRSGLYNRYGIQFFVRYWW